MKAMGQLKNDGQIDGYKVIKDLGVLPFLNRYEIKNKQNPFSECTISAMKKRAAFVAGKHCELVLRARVDGAF